MFRIVSHNACWFQGFPYAALDPDAAHPEVLDRLTAIYRSHRPHVVCVQEVQHARMAELVAGVLELDARYSPGGHYPLYGCSTFAAQVDVIAEGQASALPPQRAWHICRAVDEGMSLTIANVHLTSDRFLSKAEAARARLDDLTALLQHKDGPDVICGDFNEGPRDEAATLLERQGYVDAAIATDASLPSTGVGKKRSDQIWVRAELETSIAEFGAGSWESMAFDAPGKNVLSDHLPLWIVLRR